MSLEDTNEVKALKTCEAGYTYNVCLRCVNSHTHADIDNWKIVQAPTPCDDNSLITPAKIDQEIPYNPSASSVQVWPDDSTFFQSTAECPIFGCSAWESSDTDPCSTTSLSATNIIFAADYSVTVS